MPLQCRCWQKSGSNSRTREGSKGVQFSPCHELQTQHEVVGVGRTMLLRPKAWHQDAAGPQVPVKNRQDKNQKRPTANLVPPKFVRSSCLLKARVAVFSCDQRTFVFFTCVKTVGGSLCCAVLRPVAMLAYVAEPRFKKRGSTCSAVSSNDITDEVICAGLKAIYRTESRTPIAI